MGFINKVERKFGRFSVSGIVRVIAGFQFLVWCLLWFDRGFLKYLVLDPSKIMHGEVWRVVSFALVPSWQSAGMDAAGEATYLPSFWTLIAIYFLFFIGEGLEQAWGSFKTNLYVFGGILGCVLGAFVTYLLFIQEPSDLFAFIISTYASTALFSSILFAFACFYPNLEIRLMLVIPIKMKWVALMNAGFILLSIIRPGSMLFTIFTLCALSAFFIVYVPQLLFYLKHRSTVAARKARFESGRISDEEPLHRCDKCGTTDLESPELEFRVSSDGQDLCENCRSDEPPAS